jgi:hypothetical protein
MITTLRAFAIVFGLMFSISAWAAALVESITGSVSAGPTAASTSAVSVGQRIDPGTTVVTGANSRVILRFDDGQAMLLNDNTEFRVAEYAFIAQEPAKDRFVFDLLRGAARSVTAALTRRSPNAYALRAPNATIGIRGTDFMVALANQTYMNVLDGVIAATNAAGTATFAAGAVATVASATTLAVSIAATALPAAVAASFSEMGSIALSAAAAGAGASGATGAAAGGITTGVVAAGVAAVAGIAALTSSNNQQPTPGTGTR